jgi:hypothetical protein
VFFIAFLPDVLLLLRRCWPAFARPGSMAEWLRCALDSRSSAYRGTAAFAKRSARWRPTGPRVPSRRQLLADALVPVKWAEAQIPVPQSRLLAWQHGHPYKIVAEPDPDRGDREVPRRSTTQARGGTTGSDKLAARAPSPTLPARAPHAGKGARSRSIANEGIIRGRTLISAGSRSADGRGAPPRGTAH